MTFNAVDKDYKKKYLPGGRKYAGPAVAAGPAGLAQDHGAELAAVKAA